MSLYVPLGFLVVVERESHRDVPQTRLVARLFRPCVRTSLFLVSFLLFLGLALLRRDAPGLHRRESLRRPAVAHLLLFSALFLPLVAFFAFLCCALVG